MTAESDLGHPTAKSPAESVVALTAHRDSFDRATQSVPWAVATYKLGMAIAEQASAQPQRELKQALECYQQAATILSAQRAPIEHARILNAAGSAHRLLGDPATASRLFAESHALLEGRGEPAEEAAVLNNLGLAHAESGRIDDAIAMFDRSIDVLDGDSEGVVRTRLATLHNLGQAHMGRGSVEGISAAVGVFKAASTSAREVDVPMHAGMLDHSLGVAYKALATLDRESQDQHLAAAIEAFERSLTVFTSVGFPMHHAIAKHNLGHALAGHDDLASLRRALAYYEDALNIFDPRLHQAHWQEAYSNVEALEARLLVREPEASRADHIASLAGSMGDDERLTFVRHRLLQWERLPDQHRQERLTSFCHAMVTQPPASFVATLRTFVTVLMELPEPLLEASLRAQLQAHALLDNHDQRAADFVLDEVIQALLFGPQRVRVRDILEDIGWHRP